MAAIASRVARVLVFMEWTFLFGKSSRGASRYSVSSQSVRSTTWAGLTVEMACL